MFPQALITLTALNSRSLLQLFLVLCHLLAGPAQTPVASLSCSGVIHLDMQGAEERVIGLLSPLGCIPCYASSHELQDLCNGRQILKVTQPLWRVGWVS